MLLLNVTMVTTGHQKLPKMGQNSIKSSFFARRAKKASAKGRSPPQKLEVGPRSGPYLLVLLNEGYTMSFFNCCPKYLGNFKSLPISNLKRIYSELNTTKTGSNQVWTSPYTSYFLLPPNFTWEPPSLTTLLFFIGQYFKQACCAGCRRRPFPIKLNQ